jgi:hypothetical protein
MSFPVRPVPSASRLAVRSTLPMPAQPLPIHQPKHPLYALTTYELRNYRRDLENAIKNNAPDAAIQAELQRRLDVVIAEQESRARLATTLTYQEDYLKVLV